MNLLLSTTLLTACLAGLIPDSYPVHIFIEGNEERAEALIAPHGSDDLVLAGWSLTEMVVGPACEVRMVFSRGGDTTSFRYGPEGPDCETMALTAAPGAFGGPDALRARLEELLASNHPREVFRNACEEVTVALENPEEAPAATAEPSQPVLRIEGLREASHSMMLLGLPALLAFLLLRRRTPTVRPPRRPRRELFTLLMLMAGGVALRGFVAAHLPPEAFELENFPRTSGISEVLSVIGSFLHPPPPHTFHAPLLPALLQGWLGIGDALGVGGQLLWIRLANVGLAVVMIWLLLRLGEALGDSRVGWLSAAAFALSPPLIFISVPQGHYFLEMVAATWFLERLAVGVVQGREVHRSLALAAAAALWSGFLSAVLIVPGLAFHVALTWRRGEQRRALNTLLLVTALTAPVLGAALSNMLEMGRITSSSVLDSARNEGLAAVWGHASMPPGSTGLLDVLQNIRILANTTFGVLLAPLAVLAMLGQLFRSPRDGWLPIAALFALCLLGLALPIRPINLIIMIPLVLAGGLRALRSAGVRLLRRPPARLWDAMILATLLAGAALTNISSTSFSCPLPEQVAGWIRHGDLQEAVSVTMLGEDRERTLVRGTFHEGASYLLCEDRSNTRALVRCLDRPLSGEREAGTIKYELDGRAVWELPRTYEVEIDNPHGALVEGWGLTKLDGSFLMVLDKDYHAELALVRGADPVTLYRCHILHEGWEASVWRCGGNP